MIGNGFIDSICKFDPSRYEIFGIVRDLKYKRLDSVKTVYVENIFINIDRLIGQYKPDLIINCIGIVSQKFQKCNTSDIIKWNSLWPNILMENCINHNIKLLQISTDCIFDGVNGCYDENNQAYASGLYGTSKRLGEISGKNVKTVRLSTIGFEDDEQKHGLLEWFLSQKTQVMGYEKVFYSGFATSELYRVVDWVLMNWDVFELAHIPGIKINKYQLLKKISLIYGHDVDIQPISFPKIDRSLITINNLHNMIEFPNWDEQLVRLKKCNTRKVSI